MSVSNHDYKEQFNARFEAEKECRRLESELTDLQKRVREAVGEMKGKAVLPNDDPGNIYFGMLDILRKHGLIEEE